MTAISQPRSRLGHDRLATPGSTSYFDLSSPLPAASPGAGRSGPPQRRHGRIGELEPSCSAPPSRPPSWKSPVSYPIKREYLLHRLRAPGASAGVRQLKNPQKFPISPRRTPRACSGGWLDGDAARRGSGHASSYRAYFRARRRPERDAAQLRELRCGIFTLPKPPRLWFGQRLLARKARLKAENEAASIAAGGGSCAVFSSS